MKRQYSDDSSASASRTNQQTVSQENYLQLYADGIITRLFAWQDTIAMDLCFAMGHDDLYCLPLIVEESAVILAITVVRDVLSSVCSTSAYEILLSPEENVLYSVLFRLISNASTESLRDLVRGRNTNDVLAYLKHVDPSQEIIDLITPLVTSVLHSATNSYSSEVLEEITEEVEHVGPKATKQ